MAHGKETPRQKMIGMMYLVLLALLALNVSAEVLDAFRLVNEGIKNTTENFAKKNRVTYNEFEQEVAKNEQKAGKWRDAAFEVRAQADSLYNFMQDLKVQMVKENQGKDIEQNEALVKEDGKVQILQEHVIGEDKWDMVTRVMIGENFDGKAYDLKERINEFRQFLLEYIDKEDTKIIEGINKTLDTSDPPPTEGHEQKTWEVKHFYDIPLGAVLPIISKFQSDVRNAESEAIRYLFNQIEAGSFAFNKLEANVIPNTNYVIQGNEYRADVFLAARDTTAPPEILIGEWDSVRQEDGTYEIEMTSVQETLEVKGGKGKFVRQANRTGMHEWGGIIKLMGPEGDYIKKPFKQEFEVAEPNLVISPTKMNVFYVGIANPVSISIPSVPPAKITPNVRNGSIYEVGPGQFEVTPDDASRECVVSVRAEVEGQMRSYGSKEFRVEELPTPTAQVAQKSGGEVREEILRAQSGIFAVMEDFLFDLQYEITRYTITTTDRGGYVKSLRKEGNQFDQEVRNWFENNLERGRKVNFEDLEAVGPDGEVKSLSPITFTIQ
ncbi:MAG: gliding motility protein GldM [Bacteroidales bacterium]|nr:gliding motility protein GldM [Bacteroidales bacterium]